MGQTSVWLLNCAPSPVGGRGEQAGTFEHRKRRTEAENHRFNPKAKTPMNLIAMLMAAGISTAAVTPEAAREFVQAVEQESYDLYASDGRLAWINATYITVDSQILLTEANEAGQKRSLEWARQAAKFLEIEEQLDFDTRRKLGFLARSFVMPPPNDPELLSEMSELQVGIPAQYSSYRYCRSEDECLDFETMNNIMGTSRNPEELLEIWQGWRGVSPAFKDDYQRLVSLMNTGASDLGFADAGELWRSGYDMPPGDFAAELDRLVGQLSPLYEALHCHVRAKLNEHYGDEVAPASGPIPAHLLGNMWAQTWSNIFPLMGLEETGTVNITEVIAERGLDELDMVRIAEDFFVSLGFERLPETFWERSLFLRPADRNVVCYASAWNVDAEEDVRLKMCIQRNEEDFNTLHHELGHNYYQLAYNQQDFFYRASANDGFHEAVGDTLSLSVTPEYFRRLGWMDETEQTDDIALLLKSALDNVALVPWTYLVDQWRWDVFSGETTPDEYNQAWWDLRLEVQGVAPPLARDETQFDAGAKYHVPASVPYNRYFLARILQFQFHRALCEEAGFEGPLHLCSIYGSKAAGARLKNMLEMGTSRPWPEALEALTGTPQMDATAMADYYAPLKVWLDEQNEGRECGW